MSKCMYLNDIFLVIRVSLNVCRGGNCLLKCFKLINGRYLYVGKTGLLQNHCTWVFKWKKSIKLSFCMGQ